MAEFINNSRHRKDFRAANTCDEEESRSDKSDPEAVDFSCNSTNKSTSDAGNSNNSDREELAKKETKAVLRLRVLVFLVLVGTAVAVSVAVYFISTNAERNQFEAQFQGSAERIKASFEDIVNQKVAALGSLALAFTSYASSHNMTWPFVIMKAFPYQAATTLSLSEAMFVGYYPIITKGTRAAWEKFAVDNFYEYAIESITYQEKQGIDPFPPGRRPPFLQTREQLDAIHAAYLENNAHNATSGQENQSSSQVNTTLDFSSGMSNHIYYFEPVKMTPAYETGPGPYFPIVQGAPIVSTSYLNLNLNHPSSQHYGRLEKCANDGKIVLTGFDVSPPGDVYNKQDQMTPLYALWLSFSKRKETSYEGDPMSNLYIPVFDSFEDNRTAVAVVNAVINWKTYFTHILPENIKGVIVVLTNECVGSYTYEVNGANVTGIGTGDLHDRKFDHLERLLVLSNLTKVSDGTELGLELNQEGCPYTVRVYPSQTMSDQYSSAGPIIVTCCVAVTFVFTATMFLFYDRLVERRQRLVLFKAKQSTALVTSLFPKNVRDRLLPDNVDMDGKESSSFVSAKRRVKSFLAGGSGDKQNASMQPIADLFPHATVMFADIAGFTAWASTRDPSQVFVLLQSIYQAFDEIAARRKVFKVETIGDSYVAVAGLPDPQANHAVIMARFAWECIRKLTEVCKEMERSLGPDTGELEMRFGLHSGPVTAGVLLGDRARFQLFGDTVNVAARMESTGVPSKVQASHATAQLLIQAGKSHWVQPRQDVVVAKGKGVMSTHWIDLKAKADSSGDVSSVCSQMQDDFEDYLLESHVKHSRLVDWIVELFLEHIKKVAARHESTKTRGSRRKAEQHVVFDRPQHSITLDEVAEVINMPTFDSKAVLASEKKVISIEIAPTVVEQLSTYVGTIASAYRDNPFHNFEHACHVTMAVDKFLRRIVAPDLGDETYNEGDGKIASHLHDYTHGINSDPLTIFAIVFSALIHDVDHRGVSNVQLMKEEEQMANLYRNKSVAEQNSLDISWDLLMSADFVDLRGCLFPTKGDLLRFRQVIVNVVLATDIFDKELNDLRKARWEKAFSEDAKAQNSNYNDLRATIVIEHIIQASDVSHTMQHWHVYRKWNARLFKEMHKAFREGRMGVDPSTFWYKGELGFFDNYIIPLAKKLAECQVFGVSSDECLNYAELNRAEWEQRGEEIIKEMMEEILQPVEQFQEDQCTPGDL